ncbi:MAG: hypothetical protein RMJ43_04370 [Chloroherpetonaceae bacterium]|nr:hypothetical protein [Chthonomonadaceae bacterium]MDW8207048.1 hypothetical protein [Chloroherpetonaceae bacterium]
MRSPLRHSTHTRHCAHCGRPKPPLSSVCPHCGWTPDRPVPILSCLMVLIALLLLAGAGLWLVEYLRSTP